MKIQKRNFVKYMVLNCLTLGIYGFIVGRQLNDEIEAVCKGDKQRPGVGYAAAVFIRLVPVFGAIYFNYWWYQQANRLKLNANRYNLDVKESGTDVFLMRTAMELPLFLGTFLEMLLSLLVPAIVIVLFALIHPVIGIILGVIAGLILGIFGGELTVGANISNFYMMKNLARYADVYSGGGMSFDPMAYEYYPAIAVNYPDRVGDVINPGPGPVPTPGPIPDPPIPTQFGGVLLGEKGTCAGYKFDLTPGEEIIIGKDAKVASVVIDPAYKEISRKHVGVTYDIVKDQYCVVDYSSNGTWANGRKMVAGQAEYLPHGTELELANHKNKFLLG